MKRSLGILLFIVPITILTVIAINRPLAPTDIDAALPPGCSSDYNKNGTVHLDDFAIFAQNYRKQSIDCKYDVVNNDCYLNLADFQEFAQLYKVTNACVDVVNPPPPPPPEPTEGIWLSTEEIMSLPITGQSGCATGSSCATAWNRLLADANSSWGSANLGDNNSDHDVLTLAGALVSVRLNDSNMRNKTIAGLQSAMVSPLARSLELSRGFQTYVIAADIIGYRTTEFKAWVRSMLDVDVQPHTGGSSLCNTAGVAESCNSVGGMVCTAIRSPNNWGTMARASVIAGAMFIDDNALLQRMVSAHKSFIGENVTNSLYCQNTNWHADPVNRYGINKLGSTIQGIDVSGVTPEDWRRGEEFKWPPTLSGYMWETMQGYVVSSVMLSRAGLVNIYSGDNALKRTMDILYFGINYPPVTDDTWIPWVVNKSIGTNYSRTNTSPGKNMGYTDWTHQ